MPGGVLQVGSEDEGPLFMHHLYEALTSGLVNIKERPYSRFYMSKGFSLLDSSGDTTSSITTPGYFTCLAATTPNCS